MDSETQPPALNEEVARQMSQRISHRIDDVSRVVHEQVDASNWSVVKSRDDSVVWQRRADGSIRVSMKQDEISGPGVMPVKWYNTAFVEFNEGKIPRDEAQCIHIATEHNIGIALHTDKPTMEKLQQLLADGADCMTFSRT